MRQVRRDGEMDPRVRWSTFTKQTVQNRATVLLVLKKINTSASTVSAPLSVRIVSGHAVITRKNV